jgi:hypothetical protein
LQYCRHYHVKQLQDRIKEATELDIPIDITHTRSYMHNLPAPTQGDKKRTHLNDIWDAHVERKHRSLIETKFDTGQLVYYSQARMNLSAYEQRLQQHLATVKNTRIYQVQQIDPQVLDSTTKTNRNGKTIRELALEYETDGQRILSGIDDTNRDLEVQFITSATTISETKKYIDGPFRTLYCDSVLFTNPDEVAPAFITPGNHAPSRSSRTTSTYYTAETHDMVLPPEFIVLVTADKPLMESSVNGRDLNRRGSFRQGNRRPVNQGARSDPGRGTAQRTTTRGDAAVA